MIGWLQFLPDSRSFLATGGYVHTDQVQRIFDVKTGKAVTTYNKHDNVVPVAAMTPDGGLVATAGFNGDIQNLGPEDRRDEGGAERHGPANLGRGLLRR